MTNEGALIAMKRIQGEALSREQIEHARQHLSGWISDKYLSPLCDMAERTLKAEAERERRRWCTVSYSHMPHDTCDGSAAVPELEQLHSQLTALTAELSRKQELVDGMKRRIGVALNDSDANAQWMLNHIRGMQRFLVEWEKRAAARAEIEEGK